MIITGKDAFSILARASGYSDRLTYEELSEKGQEPYDAIAAAFYNEHIQPLQALVKDYAAFTDIDGPTVDKWRDQWRDERDELAARAKQLIGLDQ